MAESSAVIQSATPGEVSRTGSVFGNSRLTSPASAPTGPLTAWASLARTQPDLPAWLYWHFGFSCLFLAGYFMLAAAALRILAGRPVRARRGSPPHPVSVTLGWRLLAVTGCGQLAVILVATACTAGPIASGQPPGKAWAWAIQVLAVLTWAAALWLVGWFCYRAWDQREALLPLAQAAKIQRFSLVIAALLIVIAVVPGTNTLEQMPDVQRAWFGAAGVATAALGAAIVAQLLLAFVMLNIGRLRVRRARQRVGAAAGRKPVPHYRGWILTSAAFLLVAGLAWISGQARISLAVAVIPGVLCAVALVSWIAGLVTGLFTGRALADVAPEPAALTAQAAHAPGPPLSPKARQRQRLRLTPSPNLSLAPWPMLSLAPGPKLTLTQRLRPRPGRRRTVQACGYRRRRAWLPPCWRSAMASRWRCSPSPDLA